MLDKNSKIFSHIVFIVIAFLIVCVSVIFCENQRVDKICSAYFNLSVANVSVLVITIVIGIAITSVMIILIKICLPHDCLMAMSVPLDLCNPGVWMCRRKFVQPTPTQTQLLGGQNFEDFLSCN